MIKNFTLLLFIFATIAINAQNINIPDANFKQALVDNTEINTDGDTEISVSEAEAYAGAIDLYGVSITVLTGIEHFINITELDCSDNQLTDLDISKNTKLTILYCSDNQLSNLDISTNTLLTNLECSNNQLSQLGLNSNVNIRYLNFENNQISNIDINMLTELKSLTCSNNQLSSLNISSNVKLTFLSCSSNQITSLDITNQNLLTTIQCNNNQLTKLNLSTNSELAFLYCTNNQLNSLDISNNTELLDLNCSNNELNTLDISKNTKLSFLLCPNNKFTFTELYKIKNYYSDLNYTSTKKIFSPQNGSNDFEIDYSSESLFDGNETNFIWYTSADEEVGDNIVQKVSSGIYKFLKSGVYYCKMDNGLIPGAQLTTESITIDKIVNIPDANFKKALVDNTEINTNGDSEISESEATAFTGQIKLYWLGIKDLTGIEYFTNITYLYCVWNDVTSLDLSKNTKLTHLNCSSNKLTGLDIRNNTAIKILYCGSNPLMNLDLSKNTEIEILGCIQNKLTSLDISANKKLRNLDCINNQLTNLDLTNNTAITKLDCDGNELTNLDLSHNTAITKLYCERNKLSSLDLSHNTAITKLNCKDNQLINLSLISNTAIVELNCNNNQLTNLDISHNTAITKLNCDGNELSNLDLSKNTAITELNCNNNQLTNLDVSHNTAITKLNCDDNKLSNLDLSKNIAITELNCKGNKLSSLDLSKNTAITELNCNNNNFYFSDLLKIKNYYSSLSYTTTKKIFSAIKASKNSEIDYSNEALIDDTETVFTWHDINDNVVDETIVKKIGGGKYQFLKQGIFYCKLTNAIFPKTELITESITIDNHIIIEIPDTNFKKSLINNTKINTDGDTEISEFEAITLKGNLDVSNLEISDLNGIEYFINIISLDCSGNPLNNLDVSNNTELSDLDCSQNKLSNLDLSKNTMLTSLNCAQNKIKNLNLENNTAIRILYCYYNQLISLDLSKNTALTFINCESNQLRSLYLNTNSNSTYVACSRNQFPFSELENIKKHYSDLSYSSPKKIFSPQEGKYKFEVDYSAESKIDGENTNYSWYKSDNTLVDEIFVKELDTKGIFQFLKPGQFYCKMTNTTFPKAELITETITIIGTEQTIDLSNIPNQVGVKDQLELNITASSGLPVNFEIIEGDANLTNNTLICNSEGTVKIKVSQAGDDNYFPIEKTIEIAVSKKEQFITFNVPSEVGITDEIDLDVTNSSGLEVSYTIVKGNASISGNTITFNELGNVIIKAINAGNDEYNETEQSYLFVVRKKEQDINTDHIPSKVTIHESLDLNLSASSGLAVDLEIISGNANLSGTTVEFIEAGEVSIKASQAGSEIYESTQETIVINVARKDQILDIQTLAGSVLINETLELVATASSNLPVTFSIVSGDAELYGNSITFTSSGIVIVKAKQKGNSEFNAVEQSIEFTVTKKTQTVSFTNTPTTAKVNDVINLNATASSNLEVSFEIIEGDANINGNQLTCKKAGTVKVKAIQAGNEEYDLAESEMEISVEKRVQTVEFESMPATVKANDEIELNASASSGLKLTFEVLSGDATINSNTITFNQAGVVEIKAIQAGNDEYEAAEATFEITVDVATGIKEILASSIKVYPNPVVNELHINFENGERKTISLYNLQGKLLLQKESFSTTEKIDVSDYKSGMYLLKIQSDKNNLTYKIIKS